MPRFVRFFYFVRHACAWVRPLSPLLVSQNHLIYYWRKTDKLKMTGNLVSVAVVLLLLLRLLYLCLGSFFVPVPGFVHFFCLYLGLPPSPLRLLCLCLFRAYVWVFRLLCCICCAFAWFVPVSGSSAFSTMSGMGSSAFSAELLVRFAPVFPLASKCKFLKFIPSYLY